ncbi:hypothetical protein JL721_9883 [Aureococcus anophagefferens]|nr:hypothetical protein JL721_9883 [Aureococcus anophagefferens]
MAASFSRGLAVLIVGLASAWVPHRDLSALRHKPTELAATAVVESADATSEDALPLLEEERAALSIGERLSRSLTFYGRVIPILARYKLAEIELERRCASEEECAVEYEELDEWGSERLRDTILELQGFYVKSGQVLSTRVDLFAEPYTDKLQILQDGLEAIPNGRRPGGRARRALRPDGVHGATLLDGRRVAVKVQRPGARPLLLADLANLKRFSKLLADALPVDYYVVFSELGEVLEAELDFLQEAQAMEKLGAAVAFAPDGSETAPPLVIPRPVPGLVSPKVLVMDFIEGVSLNNLAEEAKKQGVEPGSPEAKILGAKIVGALGEAYARMIFGAGFVHGDPHPGNVFVLPGGDVALLDCGQTKQLAAPDRKKLEDVVTALQAYRGDPDNGDHLATLADKIRAFGVELRPREVAEGDAPPPAAAAKLDDDSCLAALAVTLFGDKAVDVIPGGYSADELSGDSPLRRLKAFPQSLVLLGRAAVIIRGIASKLGVTYSLSDAWEAAAKERRGGLPPWARQAVAPQGGDGPGLRALCAVAIGVQARQRRRAAPAPAREVVAREAHRREALMVISRRKDPGGNYPGAGTKSSEDC